MNEDAHIAEIDALLRRAARSLVYPPAPSIALAVAARLHERPPQRRWLWPQLPARVAVAGLAALVLAIGVTLAVPQSRDAIAELFGLSTVRIEPELASPEPPERSLDEFATQVTLHTAQARAGFPLLIPARAGERIEPEAVYMVNGRRVVVLVYPEFDLYEGKGTIFGKGAPDPAMYREIEFDGMQAYWFAPGGHAAAFFDENGYVIEDTRRSIDRAALLWQRGDVVFRLETALSLEEAVAVARSLQ